MVRIGGVLVLEGDGLAINVALDMGRVDELEIAKLYSIDGTSLSDTKHKKNGQRTKSQHSR